MNYMSYTSIKLFKTIPQLSRTIYTCISETFLRWSNTSKYNILRNPRYFVSNTLLFKWSIINICRSKQLIPRNTITSEIIKESNRLTMVTCRPLITMNIVTPRRNLLTNNKIINHIRFTRTWWTINPNNLLLI